MTSETAERLWELLQRAEAKIGMPPQESFSNEDELGLRCIKAIAYLMAMCDTQTTVQTMPPTPLPPPVKASVPVTEITFLIEQVENYSAALREALQHAKDAEETP